MILKIEKTRACQALEQMKSRRDTKKIAKPPQPPLQPPLCHRKGFDYFKSQFKPISFTNQNSTDDDGEV